MEELSKVLSLGINDENIDVNYGYSFFKKKGWSLGAEGSILIGVPGPSEPPLEESSSSEEGQTASLGMGGRLGLYTHMKVSRSFGVGSHIGLQTMRELRNFSDSKDVLGYFRVGLSYHFK